MARHLIEARPPGTWSHEVLLLRLWALTFRNQAGQALWAGYGRIVPRPEFGLFLQLLANFQRFQDHDGSQWRLGL